MPTDKSKPVSEEKSENMVYIENDGALFRGKARGLPTEVWNSAARAWKPYETQPKPIEWGTVISEDEANQIMGEDDGE
jgi:hypothetical protein